MTAVPAELLDPVVAELDPVEVWLFGSRARGDARPDSDWDLYVVVDDGREREGWRASTGAVSGFRATTGLGVDVVVEPWSRSLVRRRAFRTLDETIDHEGRRVYARPVAPPVQDMPEISSPAEWLERGRVDAQVARLTLDNQLAPPASVAIQQAWEKALKGRLALMRRRVGKTHALHELATRVGGYSAADVARLDAVSDWGITGRYGAHPERDFAVLEAELARAVEALDALEAALTAS